MRYQGVTLIFILSESQRKLLMSGSENKMKPSSTNQQRQFIVGWSFVETMFIFNEVKAEQERQKWKEEATQTRVSETSASRIRQKVFS